MSKPVTLNPASDKSRDSGNPTYPSPMTPILAVRASIRSRRSCAICGRTAWLVFDMFTIIASSISSFMYLKSGCPKQVIKSHEVCIYSVEAEALSSDRSPLAEIEAVRKLHRRGSFLNAKISSSPQKVRTGQNDGRLAVETQHCTR